MPICFSNCSSCSLLIPLQKQKAKSKKQSTSETNLGITSLFLCPFRLLMSSFFVRSTRLLKQPSWSSPRKVHGVTHYDRIIYHRTPRKNLSTTPFPNHKMATEEISQKLATLGLSKPLTSYPNCYPEVNPFDVYRAHLTEILSEVTGVDAAIVYPSLQWTQTLEKGDLVLPIPALRVKGKKPDELAKEWAEKVSSWILQSCLI